MSGVKGTAIASVVEDLWNGRLPALPGSRDVFVPIVTVDYFSRFLAEMPTAPQGEDYWVLDDTTPNLPKLVKTVAGQRPTGSRRIAR